jgi:hypothetical protein
VAGLNQDPLVDELGDRRSPAEMEKMGKMGGVKAMVEMPENSVCWVPQHSWVPPCPSYSLAGT